MKFIRWAAVLLLFAFCQAGWTQSGSAVADSTQLAVKQATRDGRYTDAEKLVTDKVHEIEQTEPNSPRLADYLEYQTILLVRKGHDAEAVVVWQRILEIHRNVFGPDSLRMANDLDTLASFSRNRGDDQEAERLLNEALEIVHMNMMNIKSRRDSSLSAEVFGSLGSLYLGEHRWAEAEPLLRAEAKVCDYFEVPYRSGYAMCGTLPQRLAELYRFEGRTADVERLSNDENLPADLTTLNATAQQYEKDGLYPSAEVACNQAIALAKKIQADPQNRFGGLVVREFSLQGQLFEKEGLNDQAEQAYRTAFEMVEKNAALQRGHNAYAEMLNVNDLLDLYRSEGRLKDIEPLVQQVLEIQQKSLGERNHAVVLTLVTLAGVYKEEGNDDPAKYTEARPVYERALTIQQTNVGPDDPLLIGILTPYGDLLRKLHDDRKAAEVQERVDAIQKVLQSQNRRN